MSRNYKFLFLLIIIPIHMSKRESLRILHIPYVYKSFMFFHMSKKHMPIAHPCLKNKFSVSDNQYPSKCQVEDKSSFLNLLYVKLALPVKKIWKHNFEAKKITSVHQKFQYGRLYATYIWMSCRIRVKDDIVFYFIVWYLVININKKFFEITILLGFIFY